MPPIARKLDLVSCPEHGGGLIVDTNVTDVIICHRPVATKGDKVLCLTGEVAEIVDGCSDVIIHGRPVARKGDKTSHGGVVLTACPRVLICQKPKAICKKEAASRGAAFIRNLRRGRFLPEDA